MRCRRFVHGRGELWRLLTRLSTSLRELSIHPPSQGRDRFVRIFKQTTAILLCVILSEAREPSRRISTEARSRGRGVNTPYFSVQKCYFACIEVQRFCLDPTRRKTPCGLLTRHPLALQSFVALAFGERVDTPLCGGRGFVPLRMTRRGESVDTTPPPTYVGPPPLTRGGRVCAKSEGCARTGRNRGDGPFVNGPYRLARNREFVHGRKDIVDDGPSRTSAPTGWRLSTNNTAT